MQSSGKKTGTVHAVPTNNPHVHVHGHDITYSGETGDVRAHYVHPITDEKVPGVIVIHEIWGLVPHIKDVTQRVAAEGFLTMAPDALSPLGGTPDDRDEARTVIRKLDPAATVKNYVAAVKYLKTHPQSNGKVGVTGFCWGGGMTNQVAVASLDVQAAVPFYGRQPEPEDVPKITAALLLQYAGEDERINAGIPAFEAALNAASKEYTLHMYEGAQHAFFNDTSSRYHKDAATLAWQRTIAFFNKHLKP
jgi:carboxymethylenebutenolidase